MPNKKTVYYYPLDREWFRGVSPEAQEHLRNSLDSLKTSQDPRPSVPLYGKTDWSVVEEYYKFAEQKGHKFPKWQLEYELSRESKFGQQGGHASWDEIRPDVEMYVTNVQPCNVPPIDATIKKYGSLNCKIRSAEDVVKHQKYSGKIEDTAAGWRNFNLKKDDPEAQTAAIRDFKDGSWKDSWAYIFSYIRKRKNRIFVPAPFCVNIGQAKYHDPFLEAIQLDLRANLDKSEFAFWGDKVSFKTLFTEIMPRKKTVSIPGKVLYVVRDFFHMDTTQGASQKSQHYIPKLAAAFGIKHGTSQYRELEDIINFSNKFPIATPQGIITEEDKGEGSGATVTNNGETACNEDFDFTLTELILSSLAQKGFNDVFKIDSYGNGDDGISRWYIPQKYLSRVDEIMNIIDECADRACAMYGYVKNDKWKMSLEFGLYCQYELYEDEQGNLHADYPVSLALNAGINPMKEITKAQWDSDFVDWRWEQVLRPLSNRTDFPLIIEYVNNGLKKGLFGKDAKDFRRILSKYDRYRALRESSYQFNVWEDIDDDPLKSPVLQELAKLKGLNLDQLR